MLETLSFLLNFLNDLDSYATLKNELRSLLIALGLQIHL